MNAEQIEKSIRDRIAEIDAQTAPLLQECARLRAMLAPQEVRPFVAPPVLPIMPSPPDLPVWLPFGPHCPPPLPTYIHWVAPNSGTPIPPWGTTECVTICTTDHTHATHALVGDIRDPALWVEPQGDISASLIGHVFGPGSAIPNPNQRYTIS